MFAEIEGAMISLFSVWAGLVQPTRVVIASMEMITGRGIGGYRTFTNRPSAV